jgi:hypothetical protein
LPAHQQRHGHSGSQNQSPSHFLRHNIAHTQQAKTSPNHKRDQQRSKRSLDEQRE